MPRQNRINPSCARGGSEQVTPARKDMPYKNELEWYQDTMVASDGSTMIL